MAVAAGALQSYRQGRPRAAFLRNQPELVWAADHIGLNQRPATLAYHASSAAADIVSDMSALTKKIASDEEQQFEVRKV